MIVTDRSEHRLLERQVLEVSEREQQRIGQDLHDGPAQELIGAAYMLQTVRVDKPSAQAQLRRISQLLDRSVGEIRELAKGYYPVELERQGLQSALEELSRQISETFAVKCELVKAERIEEIDKAAQIHLFRITQEAVRNAVRHGHAHNVFIEVSRHHDESCLSVHSDGDPFPAEKLRESLLHGHGMGLRIMNYRARLLGGSLEITPAESGGCTVTCAIPVANHHAGDGKNGRDRSGKLLAPTLNPADPLLDPIPANK